MDREDQFIPHLVVSDGLAAMEFYKEVFNGSEGDNMKSPDGKLMHGEIVVDGYKLFVSDWFAPSDGGSLNTPEKLGGTCVRITIEVDDADSVMERAVARGSSVIMPVADMFWGARYGKIRDPYGHEWGINQQLKKQSDEETRAAADKFFGERN
ncbi:MAG: VOC family protein [Acidobacteriota bacterium]